MKYIFLISTVMLFGVGHTNDTQLFIKKLENDNNISYENIIHTQGAYIPPICYSKTKNLKTGLVSNPCYSCHTKGKSPNYMNDSSLQLSYNFPKSMLKNPYTNLFKKEDNKVAYIDDGRMMEYVNISNYFDDTGEIVLSKILPDSWKGYIPDCRYNFDEEGFDRDKKGKYTGWRAFRYYPFTGLFWPRNGSLDDVLIRLDSCFRKDSHYTFNKEIYNLNFAIIEALVKQKEIAYDHEINEKAYGVDIDADGEISHTKMISPHIQSYVGLAKQYLSEKIIHLAPGLFPEGTEFLHSLRYLAWDESKRQVVLSKRMKELRYTKKYRWKSYGQLKRVANAELWEAQALDSAEAKISIFRGNYEEGFVNEKGWIYQGFIEDKAGALRPQTHEETLSCMGCHSHLGVTTDSSFSFARKLEGDQKNKNMYGWGHWSQQGLSGMIEPSVTYLTEGKQYEYSFYLKQNHSVKQTIINSLHQDISVLLYPSKSRALLLNKIYKVFVEEQSYIYGKEPSIDIMTDIHKEIKEGQLTGIKKSIIQE